MSFSISGTIFRQVGTDTSLLGTLTANIAAFTTLTVTGASGSVTSITINGVEVLGAAVAYNTSAANTAALIVNQINTFSATHKAFRAGGTGALVTVSADWPLAADSVISVSYEREISVSTYESEVMAIIPLLRKTGTTYVDGLPTAKTYASGYGVTSCSRTVAYTDGLPTLKTLTFSYGGQVWTQTTTIAYDVDGLPISNPIKTLARV